MDLAALFVLLAPLALAAVALVARIEPGRQPRRVLGTARTASLLAIGVALAAIGFTAFNGPVESPLLGIAGIGVSVRIDALSVAMLGLIAFLGWVVLEYSRAYLDGDPRHGRFVGQLALTIATAMLLVISANLVQLTLLWLATSLALHRLLLFYADRPGAIVAARKKFIVARLGDVALAGAAILLAIAFGTTDLGELLARTAEPAAGDSFAVQLAAVLLVATAALKSAQFPTHGWLAEVMETPTPVSALLHAGVLNGGIFLIVRFAPIVLLSPAALALMVIVGGVTALFASLVMITQPTVKGGFAYSSAAHMGFMLLLSGLGMYSIAIAHLIAHSCYKAHAFLSSGSAIEVSRTSKVPGGKPRPGIGAIVAAFLVAIVTVIGVGAAVGVSVTAEPVLLGVAIILAIGLTQLLAQAAGRSGWLLARVGLAAGGTALAFFALEIAASALLAPVVPRIALHDPLTLTLMTLVIAAFGFASLAQLLLPALSSCWPAAYVHVRNGFYANALFDRAVGALRPISPAMKEAK